MTTIREDNEYDLGKVLQNHTLPMKKKMLKSYSTHTHLFLMGLDKTP